MHELILERGRTEQNYWRNLWRFRELFVFLAWRDLLIRYKQTAIGIVWALIKPALTLLVIVGFRRMTSLSAGTVPDPIFVIAAVLPWMFFSTALGEAANSLIGSANLISKVYFPRLIIPAGAVVTSLVDFAITLVILAALMAWYQFLPGWQIVVLPLLVVLTFALSVGAGLLLAALNVEYRDFRYVVPFILQFGIFVSPVFYSTPANLGSWRLLFELNPMVGIIEGFRWSICRGATPLDPMALLLSVAVTAAFLAVGVWYFRRTEQSFADVI